MLLSAGYSSTNCADGMVGCHSMSVYVFRAIEPGVDRLHFLYSRQWSEDAGVERVIDIRVGIASSVNQ
ncbi:Chagasin family peptidase inhibitor I42 [compost metagenome]